MTTIQCILIIYIGGKIAHDTYTDNIGVNTIAAILSFLVLDVYIDIMINCPSLLPSSIFSVAGTKPRVYY